MRQSIFRGDNMHNQEIRAAIKAAGVKYWQVAEKLGLYDGNFSRKLRR